MDPSFRFNPDCSDNEAAAAGRPAQGRPTQSAWDFSSYAESVTAEHARRRTTSIDEKISLARKDRRNPVISDDSDADESGGSGEDDSDEDEEALVEGESSGDEEEELEESEDDEEAEMEGSGDEDEVETGGDSQGEDEGEDEEEGGDQEEEDGDEAEGVHEEDDNAEQDGKLEPSKFFASSEGASFHSNSFLELNLSRPLVRACEALGYQKPTPIQESNRGKKAKKGHSLVDVAYRRAKSMKATSKRLPDAGKGKIDKKAKQHSDKVPSRREEMHELFENDMTKWKQGRNLKKNNTLARQKSKNAFKSKSRYKHRK